MTATAATATRRGTHPRVAAHRDRVGFGLREVAPRVTPGRAVTG